MSFFCFLFFPLMVLGLCWCMHIYCQVSVRMHLHTAVSTKSSSYSGEGTVASLHQWVSWCQYRLWACVLSSHDCGRLSDADAITDLPLVFSFLQGETMNEDICLDTCVVHVGMPAPEPRSSFVVLGCFFSKDGCMDMFAPEMVVIFEGWLGSLVWKWDVCSDGGSRAKGPASSLCFHTRYLVLGICGALAEL